MFPPAPSSLVAPLVKEVVVVVEVVVVFLKVLADGLRWWALLKNCVMGMDCGLGRGCNGRLSMDLSPSVRPFKAILRCGPQDITFLNAFLLGERMKKELEGYMKKIVSLSLSLSLSLPRQVSHFVGEVV